MELQPLYDKSCTCIMCKKSFTTKRVRSRFVKIKEYDTDFCPVYELDGENPIFYQVKVCYHCGFSFTKDFSPHFPPGAKKLIQEKVCDKWVPQNFGETRTFQQATSTFILAAYCATLKKEKHITIAGLYMRLAWLHRSVQQKEKELRFLNLALKEYEESYRLADYEGTQVSEVRILYLLGEISRRTGQYPDAIQYFSRVVEQRSKTVERSLIDMARERWYEIREAMRTDGE